MNQDPLFGSFCNIVLPTIFFGSLRINRGALTKVRVLIPNDSHIFVLLRQEKGVAANESAAMAFCENQFHQVFDTTQLRIVEEAWKARGHTPKFSGT